MERLSDEQEPAEPVKDAISVIKQEAEQVRNPSDLASNTIMLKCRECGVEEHVPIRTFVIRAKRKPYRCRVCPDHPELFVYKYDPFAVMMAGFASEQKRMGIPDDTMKEMIGIAAASPLVTGKKRKRLKKGDKDESNHRRVKDDNKLEESF